MSTIAFGGSSKWWQQYMSQVSLKNSEYLHFEILILCSKLSVFSVKSNMFSLSGKWIFSHFISIFNQIGVFWSSFGKNIAKYFFCKIIFFDWTHLSSKFWAISLQEDMIKAVYEPSFVEKFQIFKYSKFFNNFQWFQ